MIHIANANANASALAGILKKYECLCFWLYLVFLLCSHVSVDRQLFFESYFYRLFVSYYLNSNVTSYALGTQIWSREIIGCTRREAIRRKMIGKCRKMPHPEMGEHRRSTNVSISMYHFVINRRLQ